MADTSKRLEKAEKLVQKGKIEEALAEYLQAFKEDPSKDSVAEVIAELYIRQKQPKQALDCYEYLFQKHVERKDGPAAVLMYRKMVRLGMQDAAHILICARFLEKQKPAEARDNYKQSAKMFLEKGEQAQALEALEGLANMDDKDHEGHIKVAELAESLGKKEVAAKAFVRAGELLRASREPGDSGRPVELLERAFNLVPSDPRTAIVLAIAVSESGNPARAVQLLEPLDGKAVPERNRLLAEAYLGTGKFEGAEELLWAMAPTLPEAYTLLWRALEGYMGGKNSEAAIKLLDRLKPALLGARKENELVSHLEELQKKNLAGAEVMEFLVALYRELNRDAMLSSGLVRLYELYLEAGNYPKAGKALERVGEVSSDDPENAGRLEKLKPHLDPKSYKSLSSLILRTPFVPGGEAGGEAGGGPLEDMISQAELLMAIGQVDAAGKYLEEIKRRFSGEETRNERLRGLFVDAGLMPKPAAAAPKTQEAAAPKAAEASIADITRVAEIGRQIHRQSTVKGMLSTCVNEIGKAWQTSRCMAGLCAPGEHPTAAMEHCAPGIKATDAASFGKLVTTLVHLTADGKALAVEDAPASPKLSAILPVLQAQEIESLLALPLMDGEKPTGVIVLEQCGRTRAWGPHEVVVLNTIMDQLVMAMAHVKMVARMKWGAVDEDGLLQRSSYLACLVSESERAQKQNSALSVVLLQFGRGQQTIQEFGEDHIQQFMHAAAQALGSHLRQNDVGVRYDLTTLAVVLPAAKGKDTLSVVDKIRKTADAIKIDERESMPLTAGIAEAVLQRPMDPVDSVTEVINRLEAALAAARKEGVPFKVLAAPVAAPSA